jgi:lipopolysaccharide export system permease protein
MNRIFFKYIARSFWAPFGFGLAVFCLLLLFGSLFDTLNFFIRSGAGAGVFFRYVFDQAPYFAVKMTPIATLLAVLFSMGGMISRGEWKAGLAGGWRPFDMIKPLLVCSLAAGAGQFVLQETVAPGLYLDSTHLYEEKMRGREDWRRLVRKDVMFSADGETFVTADVFDGIRKTMAGVVADTYRGGRLALELNARSASWQQAERRWVFNDGVMIRYDEDKKPLVTRFAEYRSAVSVPPENLVLEKLVPEGISSLDLLSRLGRLKAVGSPSTEERTLLWVKLATPLANPAMALIGAAMVLLIRKNNRLFSFGLALGMGFFFWAVMIMAQGAGTAELVPPWVAGLAPACGFALFSLWGLRRARAI